MSCPLARTYGIIKETTGKQGGIKGQRFAYIFNFKGRENKTIENRQTPHLHYRSIKLSPLCLLVYGFHKTLLRSVSLIKFHRSQRWVYFFLPTSNDTVHLVISTPPWISPINCLPARRHNVEPPQHRSRSTIIKIDYKILAEPDKTSIIILEHKENWAKQQHSEGVPKR